MTNDIMTFLERDGKTWTKVLSRNKDKPWASEVEVGSFLEGLIKLIKPRVIVEIGTFEGDTAFEMAIACYVNKRGHVYTYDVEDYGFASAVENNTWIRDYISVLKRNEVKLAKNIDLAFIDGKHTYEAVKQDLSEVYANLSKGGIIVLHDTHKDYKFSEGINRAIFEFCEDTGMSQIFLNSYQGLTILGYWHQ